MVRRTFFTFTTFSLMILMNFTGILAATDELDEQQKKMQADIEHSLVAPCCWNMTVDEHDSPKSRAVRAKITELIKQGKTKQEILNYFSAKPEYGERILATPSQDTLLGKSAYWLIPVAILLGALLIVGSLKKWSSSKGRHTNEEAVDKPENSPYAAKVEEELKSLE